MRMEDSCGPGAEGLCEVRDNVVAVDDRRE